MLQKDMDRLLTLPSNLEIREGGKVWIKSLNKYLSSLGVACPLQARPGGASTTKIKLALIDEKGLTLNSFSSVTSCAEFLGISRKTVTNKLNESRAVEFNNKLIFIKKIESDY